MKLIILTSSKKGTAAHHLPYLIKNCDCEVSALVYNAGKKINVKRTIKQKAKKIKKIGILGAINGIRIRRWYNEDLEKYLQIENVRKLCEKFGLPYFEVPEINCSKTVELFEELSADVGLSLGNGYISEKVFKQPKCGMINIHHEILPEYQNAQSVIWQIYNQSKTTGYSIHQINKNIDEGDILYQKEVPINFEGTLSATVSKTYALLWKKSAKGLVHVLNNFNKYYKNAIPQGKGNTYTTPTMWEYIKIYKNYKKLKENQTLDN